MKNTLLAKIPSNQRVLEIMRYLLIGGLTFLLFMAVSTVPHIIDSVPHSIASGLAVLVSGVFNFLAHNIYTFRSQKPLSRTAPRYLLLIGSNSIWGGVLVNYLIYSFGVDSMIANVVCAIAVTLFSYPAMRFFVN